MKNLFCRIKNCSKSYDAHEQVAHPEAGATVPAGKDDKNELDTLRAKHTTATVTDAKATPGAAQKAIDAQCGHKSQPKDNMATGNSGMGPNVEKNTDV